MHHLVRSTLAASALIVAVGVAFAIQPRPPEPTPPPAAPPAHAASPQPSASGTPAVKPALTQRRGEWSPMCAATGQPLIDFSSIDRGQGLHRILLTVHNCSDKPVELTEPVLWNGGREGYSDYLRLDAERTHLTPLTLPAWESAQAVFTWEGDGSGPLDKLSIRLPGIGAGELEDALGLTSTTRAWLSGWTR